jgi:hypothetical protein
LKAAPREGAAFFDALQQYRCFGGAYAKPWSIHFSHLVGFLKISLKRQDFPREDYTKGHEMAIFDKNFYSNASFGPASSWEKPPG